MDLQGYISIQDILKTLGISAPGLDKQIKSKGVKKEYDRNRAYISLKDFEIIKKEIKLNGRVKKILKQDKEDEDTMTASEKVMLNFKLSTLKKENETLEKDKEFLQQQVASFHNIIALKETDIKLLNDNIKLLESENTEEISNLENELNVKDEVYIKLDVENKTLQNEINILNNQTFIQKLKKLFN